MYTYLPLQVYAPFFAFRDCNAIAFEVSLIHKLMKNSAGTRFTGVELNREDKEFIFSFSVRINTLTEREVSDVCVRFCRAAVGIAASLGIPQRVTTFHRQALLDPSWQSCTDYVMNGDQVSNWSNHKIYLWW